MGRSPGLTEEVVSRLAPDDKALKVVRDLARGGSYREAGVSPDGTWIFADCQGGSLYKVSVDLADANALVGRCTCPSRKAPCKHALGLMLCDGRRSARSSSSSRP